MNGKAAGAGVRAIGAATGLGIDAPDHKEKERGEHAQLGINVGGEAPDPRPELVDEAVASRDDRQAGPRQHDEVHDVSQQNLHSEPRGLPLLDDSGESSVESPGAVGAIIEQPPRRVEDDADGVPRGAPIRLDAVGEAPVGEDPLESREVYTRVASVPAQGVGVVDVGCQGGTTRPNSGRRPSIDDELPLSICGTEAEGALASNDHGAGDDRVAEVERPAPPHGQRGKRGKDARVWTHWHELLMVVKGVRDADVAGDEGARQGKERAELGPPKEVETIHQVDRDDATVVFINVLSCVEYVP